ncbi:hypothetical protein GBA52_028859 [Prunus armeniaca]|nr:hypothetical protein GBA52_028859 [Prunus armeniaca]
MKMESQLGPRKIKARDIGHVPGVKQLRRTSHSSWNFSQLANEDGNGSKEKIVTATKKRGDDVYDAMLNQTNVGYNNNKFYVIQVLESDAGGTFMVYYRWGRVGVKGQNKIQGPYTSP